MKKLVLFFMLLIGVAVAQAREPYGDYVCRYVFNNQTGNLHSSYNPLKITHYGLQVNTRMQERRRGKRNIKAPSDSLGAMVKATDSTISIWSIREWSSQ